jgi:hypothetical protein
MLIARREAPLQELAQQIRRENGVDCVAVSLDLAAPDACERIIAAAGAREVGLYISNAGADPNGARFLDCDIDVWMELINRAHPRRGRREQADLRRRLNQRASSAFPKARKHDPAPSQSAASVQRMVTRRRPHWRAARMSRPMYRSM